MKDDHTKTLTPHRRFPHFKDRPGWAEKSFAELYAFKPTNTLSRDKLNYKSGTVRNIHYGDIHTSFQTLLDLKHEHVPYVTNGSEADFDDYAFCAEGDIVFADASEDLNDVGKSIEVLALNGERVVSGTHTILATRRDSQLIVGFGGYLFQSDRIRQQIRLEAQGSKVYGISPRRLGGINVCFPADEDEQRKIAACLKSLDEVLAAEGQKLKALRAVKKGLMQQLFPRQGESRPRLRFPEFRDAGEWRLAKASDYVDVLQGYGFPDRLQGKKDGEFPFYKVSDISAVVDSGKVLLAEAKNHIDREVLAELRAKPLPVGTTVFAKIGEAIRSNKRAVTTRPCLIDNNAAGVKAIAGAAVDEFVYYLWCMVPLIEYAGGVVPAVNKSAIEQMPLCFPEPSEQQRVADCLSSLDALVAATSLKLDGLRAHKKGLMQQLFPSPEVA